MRVPIEETIIRYTEKEVEELIRQDVKSKGYKAKSIHINTDYKNVEDEWGMNSFKLTYIKDIVVKVN